MSTTSFVQRLNTFLLIVRLTLMGFVLPATDWDSPRGDGEVVLNSAEERNEDETEIEPDPQ